MTKEVMKLALETLENFKNPDFDAIESFEQCEETIAALKEALAAPVQKPAAEVLSCRIGNDTSTLDKAFPAGTKLYTTPPTAQPAKQWVNLTDEEIIYFWERQDMWAITHAIEAKLKEKNGY